MSELEQLFDQWEQERLQQKRYEALNAWTNLFKELYSDKIVDLVGHNLLLARIKK